jgi:hypothetical protein
LLTNERLKAKMAAMEAKNENERPDLNNKKLRMYLKKLKPHVIFNTSRK